MDTESALLAALHADPADDVAWLALADWLEEHDRAAGAGWLRRHRELRTMPEGHLKVGRSLGIQEAITEGLRPPWPRFTNSIGMEFSLIPAGTFLMGSPPDELGRCPDEKQHEVEITRPFYLGVTTVTQAQYKAVTRRNPSNFRSHGDGASQVRGLKTDSFPVEEVSWDDAVAFCSKLSARQPEVEARRVYRLPTEAEWEYACRAWASSQLPYQFGRALSSQLAWYDWTYEDDDFSAGLEDAGMRTNAVGRFPPNAFGLYDMHGNVDEWCLDWYGARYYARSPRRDPQGPKRGEERVLRGGNYFDDSEMCRAACRYDDAPDEPADSRGFRVVCEWR